MFSGLSNKNHVRSQWLLRLYRHIFVEHFAAEGCDFVELPFKPKLILFCHFFVFSFLLFVHLSPFMCNDLYDFSNSDSVGVILTYSVSSLIPEQHVSRHGLLDRQVSFSIKINIPLQRLLSLTLKCNLFWHLLKLRAAEV